MKATIGSLLFRVGALALTVSVFACAQTPMPGTTPAAGATSSPGSGKAFEPSVGQRGKDVIWVPTPQELVDRMLDLAKVTPQDFLIDLGSGDGRTVITAAKRGLNAMGIEYEANMVELSRRRAREEGVESRARFEKADLYQTDLSRAQVITLFLLPSINQKLRPRLLELAPGTRVVSNTYPMGDWEPDERAEIEGSCTSWCVALLWIVPAKVQGEWRVGKEILKLTQTYQTFGGALGNMAISGGKLNGRNISFNVGDRRYEGTVDGNQMRGRIVAPPSARGEWSARRA